MVSRKKAKSFIETERQDQNKFQQHSTLLNIVYSFYYKHAREEKFLGRASEFERSRMFVSSSRNANGPLWNSCIFSPVIFSKHLIDVHVLPKMLQADLKYINYIIL